jgi:hypothetical protein
MIVHHDKYPVREDSEHTTVEGYNRCISRDKDHFDAHNSAIHIGHGPERYCRSFQKG